MGAQVHPTASRRRLQPSQRNTIPPARHSEVPAPIPILERPTARRSRSPRFTPQQAEDASSLRSAIQFPLHATPKYPPHSHPGTPHRSPVRSPRFTPQQAEDASSLRSAIQFPLHATPKYPLDSHPGTPHRSPVRSPRFTPLQVSKPEGTPRNGQNNHPGSPHSKHRYLSGAESNNTVSRSDKYRVLVSHLRSVPKGDTAKTAPTTLPTPIAQVHPTTSVGYLNRTGSNNTMHCPAPKVASHLRLVPKRDTAKKPKPVAQVHPTASSEYLNGAHCNSIARSARTKVLVLRTGLSLCFKTGTRAAIGLSLVPRTLKHWFHRDLDLFVPRGARSIQRTEHQRLPLRHPRSNLQNGLVDDGVLRADAGFLVGHAGSLDFCDQFQVVAIPGNRGGNVQPNIQILHMRLGRCGAAPTREDGNAVALP